MNAQESGLLFFPEKKMMDDDYKHQLTCQAWIGSEFKNGFVMVQMNLFAFYKLLAVGFAILKKLQVIGTVGLRI